MKETLHVKNFGPIIDAYIEIKDINIFIGTTSSGKSTIAKLIAIFKSGLLMHLPNLISPGSESQKSFMIHFNRLLGTYNIEFQIGSDTLLRYDYENLYYEIRQGSVKTNYIPANKEGVLNPIYIPAERAFFPTFSQSIFNLLSNDLALPKWLVDFGANFERSRLVLNRFRIDFLNAYYVFSNGNDFVELDNNITIKLSQASSGMQSAIPMTLVIEHFTSTEKKKDDLFIIEEPELNLYPSAQKDFIEYLIKRINISGDKLVITTHSPYLLTALDNLIQAGNIEKDDVKVYDLVSKIVPSDLWLKFNNVSCYYFNAGTVKTTLDEELESIGPSNIDDISAHLSQTFEQLLALKYRN
jgi:energy-coupling factor transporter ATP-binding protein EcfA2